MNRIPRLLVNGRIILTPIEHKEEKVGKVIVPSTANANLSTGEVVKFDPLLKELMKEGDIVVYPTGNGMGTMIKGERYVFITIAEIWAVDEPENI